ELFGHYALRLTQTPGAPRSLVSSIAARPRSVQTERSGSCRHSCRANLRIARTKRARALRLTQNETKKGAAVAGGSKVITGRRQTEWTGATQCPRRWTVTVMIEKA